MARGHEIYTWFQGCWQPTSVPRRPVESRSFVIVCSLGDWSGFRTLAQCLAQKPAEGVVVAIDYWIEER